MAGYWYSVPKGTWTVTDPTDAIEVIRDSESRVSMDPISNRINVLGPIGKAIIIDLPKILASLELEDRAAFISTVERLIGEEIK